MSTGISLLAGRGIIVKPKVPSVKRWRDFRDVAAKDGLVRDFSSGLRAKVLIPLYRSLSRHDIASTEKIAKDKFFFRWDEKKLVFFGKLRLRD